MELALGTAQFGMNYGIQGNGKPSIKRSLGILNVAYAAGIHTFDTAFAYGTAEDVLREFLRQPQIDIMKTRIVSKVNSDIKKLEISLKMSLDRMELNCLEGYLFHDANQIFDPAAVSAMEVLKAKGLTKKIGVSIYTPIQAMKALEYAAIDIIQVPYNVFDRRLNLCGFFEKAKEKGVTIYARSALLQGLLVMEPERLPEHMAFAVPYLREFRNVCNQNGLEPFDAAVQYVLQNDYIDYLVFGVDNIEQLQQFIRLYFNSKPIDVVSGFNNIFNAVEDKLIMPNLWGK